ncbi:MAG TPA: hypothetical protein VFL14_10945 [Xanthomonadales bacterium]|nr:hypothetical protein [Xanthomonadales bacterium]
MKKLFFNIAVVLVVLYVAHTIAMGAVNVRMMNHVNECNKQLDVPSRIHGPPGPQRDELFRQYEQCARDKGTFIDNFLVGDSLHALMEAMRTDSASG